MEGKKNIHLQKKTELNWIIILYGIMVDQKVIINIHYDHTLS